MKKPLPNCLQILLFLVCIIVIPSLGFGQWSKSVNLSPGAISALTNESMGPCIGVSNDTVHVVWADRFNSTKGAIYYTRSTDTGIKWSNAVAITDTGGNAWNPTIVVNGPNIHLAWREINKLNNHRTSMYKRSLDGGNTWGTSIVLDTAVADWPAIAVSRNMVYVANDIVTSSTPYNTEIFFLKSINNGKTWSKHRQVTYSVGRSEDEAITAQGSDVYMSWNDNRSGKMQIYYKHSKDYGTTWDTEVVVVPPNDYGTMVSVNGQKVDIPCAGAPTGRYQIYLVQSADSGATWGTAVNLTNDAANTYYYPFMVRDGSNLHLTYIKSGVGGQYLHSADGGKTWDLPYNMGNSQITPFIAFTGCVLHVIIPDSGHISYLRNPTGNTGTHCISTGISSVLSPETGVRLYPNPFSDQATIEIISSVRPENVILKVFDVLGHEVFRSGFGANNKITIGRSEMKSGIYFYKVFLNENVIATGKMVAQ